MRTLFHALLVTAAINLVTPPSAFAQREGGREPAGVSRDPAGGPSGREVSGGGRGGPDREGKGGKSKSSGAEKGGEKTSINHGNGEKRLCCINQLSA